MSKNKTTVAVEYLELENAASSSPPPQKKPNKKLPRYLLKQENTHLNFWFLLWFERIPLVTIGTLYESLVWFICLTTYQLIDDHAEIWNFDNLEMFYYHRSYFQCSIAFK